MSPHSLELPVASVEVVARSDDTCVIRLSGTLDLHGVAVVENELRWLVEHALRQHIQIDCRDVHFVDSSGLRLLIEVELMAGTHGSDLHVDPTPQLREILHVAGLADLAVPPSF